MLSNMSENGGSSSSSSQGVGFVVLRKLRIVRCSIHHGGENEKELCLDKLLMISASLTDLELTGLPWLTSLLLIGANLTALEQVTIENCENLRSIGNSLVSSSLKSLNVRNCPRLTVQQQADDHWGGVIEYVNVAGCPELTWLWNLNCFTSARHLIVMGCPKLTLIKSGDDSLSPMPLETVTIDDLSLLTAFPRREFLCLNSLRYLTIVGSTEEDKPFTAEQEELFQHHLTSLTSLTFYSCGGLPANLENLSSLRELYIQSCPKIESLPNLPASLKSVEISGCPKIESLPNLPASLRELRIWICPKIESLPNLPASLERVSIIGECHPRWKEEYGNDEKFDFRG